MGDRYSFSVDIYDGKGMRYNIDPALAVDQGGMMAWDEGNRRAIVMTAAAAIFLGVSLDSAPMRSLLTQFPSVQIAGQGVFKMKTTTSETYVHGTKVAMGADAQTVTTVVAGLTLVGEVFLPGGQSITGAAGQDVPVAIRGAGQEKIGRPSHSVVVGPTVAGTDKTFPVFVPDYPITVVRAGLTSAATATPGDGSSQFIAQLINKGTAGSGTNVLATLGTTVTYTAQVEQSMGTITNPNVAAGETLALFIDQQTTGLISPDLLVKIDFLPRI